MNISTKKILILGGGQAQIELIKTAKTLGLYTIVVGIKGNYPGYYLADKVYYVDINDKEAVLKIAQTEDIDGISMVCSDYGLQTVGYVCDRLNLRGISEDAALNSSNKYIMKSALENAGISTAKFLKVHNENELYDAISTLQFPVIVKAVDLQGSKGVIKCNTPKEVVPAFRNAIGLSRELYCIVEEYIEGEEFGAQAFVYNGKVLFVQPHGDIVLRTEQSCIPVGHYMPYMQENQYLLSKINRTIIGAIEALKFNNCAINVDLILKDNQPYVIELTGRAGANFLPEVTGTYLGLNYYEMILLGALGRNPEWYFNERHPLQESYVLSKQLYSTNDGKIEKIQINKNKDIRICSLFINEGDRVHAFRNSADCIGKVLCVGKSITDCKNKIENFVKNDLTININQL